MMNKKLITLLAFIASLISFAQVQAYTLTYDVAQMNADLEKARRDGGGMPRFAKDIQKYMNDLSLTVDGVKLAVDASASGGRSCSYNWNAEYHGTVTLSPESQIEFMINSLKQPIVTTLDVSGQLDGTGKLRAGLGMRILGKCVRYASARGSADIDADFKFWLSLVVDLNPVYNAATRQIILTPTSRLVGEVRNVDVSIRNTSLTARLGFIKLPIISGSSSTIFDWLLTHIANNQLNANERYQEWLATQNVNIQQKMLNKGFNSVVLNIPPKAADEAAKLGLLYLAESALSYPVPWQYLEQNNDALIFAALTNDKKSAQDILAGSAACAASNALRTNMPKQPLYQKYGAVCQLASVNETSVGIYYADSACANANVQLRSYADICDEHLKPGVMGDPKQWGGNAAGAQTGWTYSYASQFKIGYENLSNASVPFYKRINYKNISPVNDRNVTSIYSEESFNAAMAQCNTRYRYMQPQGGQLDICTQSIKKQNFYTTMPSDFSSIFNRTRYNVDVAACVTPLTTAYVANPGAYANKYGALVYTFPIPNGAPVKAVSTDGQKMIASDCETQVQASAVDPMKYQIAIDGDFTTKVTDDQVYKSYVTHCTEYLGPNGPPPQARSYSLNGQTLSCSTLRPSSDPIFLAEIEKRVPRGNGTCSLEMRVYKKDPNATNLKPLIMFHGGSWNRRAFGFVGVESLIADYTERGYIVFAPFYRLAGELDANQECNGSYSRDMAQDAMDAFTWVKTNGYQQGAQLNARPRLFGQSAGAYFVGYIVGKTTAADVEKAVMMYPPTDFISYAEDYKARWVAGNGIVSRSMGDDALEAFLDAKLDWYVSADANLKNKFVASTSGMSVIDLLKTGSHAPVYMVHGNHDLLVPVQQSVGLCNALGGSASATASTYSCGPSGSLLTVVDKAAHMLDLCIDGLVCPAEDKAAAAQALQNVKNWFIQ